MIGLALITFVAVIGQGFKSSFTDAVNTLFVADYSVSAGRNGDPLTNKAADAVATAPGVRGGVPDALRRGQGRRQDRLRHRRRREPDEGRRHHVDERLEQRPGAARRDAARSCSTRYADDNSLKVGSPLAIETPTGKTIRVHVTGIVDPPKGGSPFGEISVSKAAFDASFANHDNEFTFVNIHGGPSEANTAALEKSLAAFPAAVVETRDEFKASRTSDIPRRCRSCTRCSASR